MRGIPVWMELPIPLHSDGFRKARLELKHADEEQHPEHIVHCGCLMKGKEKHQGTEAQFSQFPYEIIKSKGNLTLTTNEEEGKRQVFIQGTATHMMIRVKAFSSCQKSELIYKRSIDTAS